MKRFLIPLVALLALVIFALTRAAPPPPIYPGTVPYQQLDTRNFELADYPVLRVMPFMARGAPPYLPVDTWSFAVDTNWWRLYGFNPLDNTWHGVNTNLNSAWIWNTYLMYSTITNLITYNLSIVQGGVTNTVGAMNPTDGYVPYRLNSTNFADSPWFRMATNKMGFAGYTNVWLEWCPDGVGLDYAVLGMGDGVFGLIDPNSTQFAAGSVGVGTRAFGAAMDARSSVALGYEAGNYATNVQGSVLIGYAVGGPDNIIDTTIVGSSAGPGSLSVTNSTYVGSSAGAQMRGSFNTTIGAWAGYTGGVNDNTNQISIGASSTVTNSNDIVIGNANNARLIVPITSWTGTGSKVLTDNGTYQTVGAAGGTNTLWTNYVSTTDMEGGTVYGMYSLNALTNAAMNQAVNNLPIFWGDNSTITFLGMNENNTMQLAEGNANIAALGDWCGWTTTFTNSGSITMLGDAALQQSTVTNSFDIFALGFWPGKASGYTNSLKLYMVGSAAGANSTWTEATNVYAWGASSMNLTTYTNVSNIYGYGLQSLETAQLSNSTNVYAYGHLPGYGLIGDGYSDIYLFGTAQPTRKTNEFVFGSANDLYTFPGEMGGITTHGLTNLQFGPKTTWLVFEGDSLTSGSGGADTRPYPYALTNSVLTQSWIVPKTNCATSGETIVQMAAQYATQIAPMKPDATHDSLLFIWGGVNDLASANALTIIGNLSNYWVQARSDGFKIVAFTVTDSISQTVTMRQEAIKLNQYIRQYHALYDFLVDVVAVLPTYAGVNVSVDNIHFSNDAAAYLAYVIGDVLSRQTPFDRSSKFRDNLVGSSLEVVVDSASINSRGSALAAHIQGQYPMMMFTDTGTGDSFTIYPYGGATSFWWQQGSGAWDANAKQMDFAAGGVSFYKNVGIATNAPSEKLEVLGNIKASGKALLKGGVQDGYTNVLTSATGKDFFYVSVPNTNGIGGHVVYTVFATDGTDVQEISGDVKFAAVAKGTTVTASTADVQAPAVVTGGSTLTAALAANTSTNNVLAIGITATTSLTTTNLLVKWRVETPSTFTVNAIP